jgi:tetratricopeptide (TPR) repeat protein
MKRELTTTDAWLAEEHPDLHHLLRAADGDAEAVAWLHARDEGLGLFGEALGGQKTALERLQKRKTLDLDGLYGPGGMPTAWLRDNKPEFHLLFEAIQGDDESLKRLDRKKHSLARLAVVARKAYRQARRASQTDSEDTSAGSLDGQAADVGCLVGELHLRQGDYLHAVEAFTRAIENTPSADAFEGRARAYQALALADERRAAELRRTLMTAH